ncbi:MAG TPA: ribosome biogenesis GTP-binding protein YihA/YsxC [Burkholderiaceae bacterium]|nr:ribosome biogenesis GTP-binding protein YihA/YsxC [Burkholderiaceae bacterium]
MQARFACTYPRLNTLPLDGLPEVAFVGRSNAGKSSAINTLAQQKALAFVSKTPGRTQHFNYFAVPQGGRGTPDAPAAGFLVDLPGYGFAKVGGQAERSHWGEDFAGYIAGRQPLAGLVMLMDVRHPLTDLDVQLLGLAPPSLPVLVLLTKSDKLTANQARTEAARVAAHITSLRQAWRGGGIDETDTVTVMPFSSLSRLNVVPARQWVEQRLGTLAD